MRMEQIRFLLESVRRGSLAAAAREAFVNQTTLSAAVAAAEKEIGGALFIRTSRGVKLTPLGRRALPHLQAIQEHYDALLALGEAAPPAPVRLAVCSATGRFWSLKAAELLDGAGRPGLIAERVPALQIPERIAGGDACLGVGFCLRREWERRRGLAAQNGLTAEALLLDRLGLYMRREMAPDRQERLPLESLRRYPLALERDVVELGGDFGGCACVFCDADTASEAAERGGLACVLPVLAARLQREDMLLLPLDVELVHYAVRTEGVALPPAGELVLTGLRAWCRERRGGGQPA